MLYARKNSSILKQQVLTSLAICKQLFRLTSSRCEQQCIFTQRVLRAIWTSKTSYLQAAFLPLLFQLFPSVTAAVLSAVVSTDITSNYADTRLFPLTCWCGHFSILCKYTASKNYQGNR